MNRPSYKELWLDEVKSNAEELERVRDAVDGNAEVYTDEPYSEGEYLARKIMQMHSRIAELEGLIDQLFEIGKGLDDGYEHYRFSEQTIPLMKLRKLTADWKEREE